MISCEIKSRLVGFRPLAYYEGGIILSKGNKIFFSDLYLSDLSLVLTLPLINSRRYHLPSFKLLTRLLRSNPGPAIVLPNNNELLLVTHDGILLCNLKNKSVNLDNNIVLGRPFNITSCSLNPNSKDISALVGDYSSNINKGPCSIHKRDLYGKWNIQYKFPQGYVNHIHSIVPNKFSDGYYILTGDCDSSSCIWKSDKSMRNMSRLISLGQTSRACWLIQKNNYLYYVSDRQDNPNYLYRIDLNSSSPINPEPLMKVNGPSIHMKELSSNQYLFSTSVEPLPVKDDEKNIFSLFDSKLPKGVLTRDICVYMGNPENGFIEIFRVKKDFWPPRLFQFGDISFPSGISSDNDIIHFYEQSADPYGISTVALKIDPLNI